MTPAAIGAATRKTNGEGTKTMALGCVSRAFLYIARIALSTSRRSVSSIVLVESPFAIHLSRCAGICARCSAVSSVIRFTMSPPPCSCCASVRDHTLFGTGALDLAAAVVGARRELDAVVLFVAHGDRCAFNY